MGEEVRALVSGDRIELERLSFPRDEQRGRPDSDIRSAWADSTGEQSVEFSLVLDWNRCVDSHRHRFYHVPWNLPLRHDRLVPCIFSSG